MPLPSVMKAAVCTALGGAIDDTVFVQQDWPVPIPSSTTISEGQMLIKVLACALAPGDARVLSGDTDYMQMPPGGLPYVPGSDVCGIVVDAGDSNKFIVGQRVVSRFDEPKPVGGLAEYRLVHHHLSELAPKSLTSVQACGLPASAMAAKRVATDFIKAGDRILVLGASGGVGTTLLQYAKFVQKASFVAATSTAKELCQELGADTVIDYRTSKWWQIEDFQKDKFDVVIDLVDGDNWTTGGCSSLAVKPSGVYVGLPSGVATRMVAHGPFGAAKVAFRFIGRMLYSRCHPRIPNWIATKALKLKDGDLADLFQDYDNGKIKAVLDPASPLPFTQEGVRRAFEIQKSARGKGKVVVKIAENQEVL